MSLLLLTIRLSVHTVCMCMLAAIHNHKHIRGATTRGKTFRKTNCESHVFAVICLSLRRFDDVGTSYTGYTTHSHDTRQTKASSDPRWHEEESGRFDARPKRFACNKIWTLSPPSLPVRWVCRCLQCSALQILARIKLSSVFAFAGLDSLDWYTAAHRKTEEKATILKSIREMVFCARSTIDTPVTPKQTIESRPNKNDSTIRRRLTECVYVICV